MIDQNPVVWLNVNRARRSLLEIMIREKRLRQAIEIFSGTNGKPDSRLALMWSNSYDAKQSIWLWGRGSPGRFRNSNRSSSSQTSSKNLDEWQKNIKCLNKPWRLCHIRPSLPLWNLSRARTWIWAVRLNHPGCRKRKEMWGDSATRWAISRQSVRKEWKEWKGWWGVIVAIGSGKRGRTVPKKERWGA